MNRNFIINSDEIQNYIKDIKKISVITKERELSIFNELKNPNLDKKTKNELYNELILGNLRFVMSVAKKYQTSGLELIDLVSEGNIGLIKAIERFDVDSGYKFISYAVHWIKQSILTAINEQSRLIRIPTNILVENTKRRKETLNENNENVEILPHTIDLYNEFNNDGDCFIDIIENKNALSPEIYLNTDEEIKAKINLMLKCLDEREKTIIIKYFGLTGIECSLEDLGEEFNCTKERVRQLKEKAIKKLRNESFEILKYL